jgi:hypothetical protein
MPGGLVQLVNKGAQDQLVTGSPSFTHFRSVYKRHTEFALEHFVLNFRGTNLNLSVQSTKTFRVKVDRNAQLVHDCYVHVTLPDIFSPVSPNGDGTATGYNFQWIPNLGYNMIRQVSVLINGTAIVTHTGEWMKLYSYLNFDGNKRALVDQMVGNVPELIDPANSYDRVNQYPHAITTSNSQAQPSILGRELVIPLHFWFCEDIGASLPLVALQYSEVEFVIEFQPIYNLFTVNDVRKSSPTYNTRIAPDLGDPAFALQKFLSVPNVDTSPQNPSLVSWELSPYIEATYVFLSDAEVVQLAKSDNAFIFREARMVQSDGIYGAGNDIELTMVNLCTQLVWVAQRSDVIANNGVDNYTNWADPKKQPIGSTTGLSAITQCFSSAGVLGNNVSERDIIVNATLVLDGAEREQERSHNFYSLLEGYSHYNGNFLPGMYAYSFSAEHEKQPSGHINGSMFNKTILRVTTQDPPAPPVYTGFALQGTTAPVCVIKSTALDKRPVPVAPGNPTNLNPDQTISIITKPDSVVRHYTYSARVYIESYNFLRITRGIANVVFSS